MKHFVIIIPINCLLFIWLSNIVVSCERNINAQSKLAINAANNVDEYWANLTSVFENHIRAQSLEMFREWNRAVGKGDLKSKITKPCLNVIEQIIRRPLDKEWSAKIIDSMNLKPPGILSGTTTELGDFDQCLSIDGTFKETHFVGKYCLATINIPRTDHFKPLPLNEKLLQHEWLGDIIKKWHQNDNYYAVASAVCFPSICRADEIREILLSYYQVLNSFEFNVTYCQSKAEPHPYDERIWIALFILAIPWLLIIPGTIYELLYGTTDITSLTGQILLSFSFLSNTRFLFNLADSKSASSTQFQFIHGIRTIACGIIIFGHSGAFLTVLYNTAVSLVARHPTDFIRISRLPTSQPFYNGALIVLIFFLISGMFLVHSMASTKKLISFPQYVFLRWLRLTPPLIGMICLTLCMEFMGSGPAFNHDFLWPTLKPCYDGWLSHMLFYSNYKDIDKTCGIHTWYISLDMQLHIVAFIFLASYVRSRRLAFWVAIFFIALGMIFVVIIVAVGLAALPLVQILIYPQFPPPHATARYIYFAPTINAIPYFIGALIGQMILEKQIVTFSKSTTRIIWAASVVIFIGLPMASLPDSYNIKLVAGNTSVSNAAFLSVALLSWSLANGWLIYQCIINPNLPIARFLSHKFFQPFSRLSFCLYLTHMMTIWLNAHQTRTTINASTMTELYKSFSLVLMQTFLLSYILHISFEAPSLNILRLITKRKSKTTTDISDNNNHSQIDKVKLPVDSKNGQIEMKDMTTLEQEKKSLIQ